MAAPLEFASGVAFVLIYGVDKPGTIGRPMPVDAGPLCIRSSNLQRHSSAGLSFYEDIRVAESGGEGDAAGGGCSGRG